MRKPASWMTTEASDGGKGYAFMTGLKTCGSVWTCAVCSYRICRQRGREVQEAIDAHMAEGGVVWLVTATMPHHTGHRLAVVLDALTDSWSYVKAGEPWKRWAKKIRYVGAIKGSEATFGSAGWHPHIHCLFFLESDPGPDLTAEFLAWFRDRWARKIESFYWDPEAREVNAWPLNKYVGGVRNLRPAALKSLFGRPHRRHGVRITQADKAGSYVAKMGLGKEVCAMDVKDGRLGNRTPWQILEDYGAHERTSDAALWREWDHTMQGRRHLVWSPGLRMRLVPSQIELSDMEVAAATPRKARLVVEYERISWWAFQSAAGPTGEDFGRIACDVLEHGDPELLAVVAQNLIREAGMLGEVRYDPRLKLMWIEPPGRFAETELRGVCLEG